jgi:hypothetical protein
LKHKYHDTVDKVELEKLVKAEDMNLESFEFGYVELMLKMNGNASEFAAKL